MATNTADCQFWDPLGYLQETEADKTNLALMILNRPLEPQRKMLWPLWRKALLKVAVDGGTNELHQMTKGDNLPDLITGDMDSCTPNIVRFYRDKGVEVIETADQDYNDFTKALKIISERVNGNKECECVVVLGSFGGRLDQVMANIHSLFEARTFLTKPVILFSPGSLAFLLNQGKHKIRVNSGLEKEWCGLVPIGSPCNNVTTTGLKWNLTSGTLKFGELISTSNTYDGSGEVTVETDSPLLWTMGFQS